jgi:uncharacterized repeat protein (TIGR03803 family)
MTADSRAKACSLIVSTGQYHFGLSTDYLGFMRCLHPAKGKHAAIKTTIPKCHFQPPRADYRFLSAYGHAFGASENILRSFNGTDGYEPKAGLIRDAKGNLYGTTQLGGADMEAGTVFELTAKGLSQSTGTFVARRTVPTAVSPKPA